MTTPSPLPSQLVRLAQEYGIQTEFWDFRGQPAAPSRETLVAVLEALGVDARTEESIERELRIALDLPWRRVLPPCVVARQGRPTQVQVHVPHGATLTVQVRHASAQERTADLPGGALTLNQLDLYVEPRELDGQLVGRATFEIPAGLPLGWFEIAATIEDGEEVTTRLAVSPDRVDLPPLSFHQGERGWGFMAQLYSVRSAKSWGLGDAADLSALTRLTGELDGDFVLINPLHASEIAGEMTPSPYLPTSRRFVNPIYIRLENIPEYADLPDAEGARVAELAQENTARSRRDETLDRTGVWEAKHEALQLIFALPRSDERDSALAAYRAEQGEGLENFALWCALTEKYREEGLPADLHHVDKPGVEAAREELADRIDYYAWLQWVVDEQLREAQQAATGNGMALGIMHDLAVGVHPTGADVWTMPDAFARGVTVGAPPDYFNQIGQDWSQPPWNPATLAGCAYRPVRDMVRTVLRHAGALRIDHIMGFFRLWWIPAGMQPGSGVYVRYDHEAMMGVLLLEAHLAGAVLVGEDLGTVEPWVREYLAERGVLGTSVFWFEKHDDARPRGSQEYRREVLATVDTHDLPPIVGYLEEGHVDLRLELGLLVDGEDQARAEAREERVKTVEVLRREGLLPRDGADADEVDRDELITAIHQFIARTPAQLIGVSLTDAVGEKRTQNQPGTNNEYPNWRVPLADIEGDLVLTEDVAQNQRLQRLIAAIREAM